MPDLLWLFYGILGEFAIEGLAADPQNVGCLLTIATVKIEHFENVLSLDRIESQDGAVIFRGFDQFAWQAPFCDDTVFRQDDRTFDHVA